jgi:putative lipoic acid-binding regulatory protein
MSEQPSLIEYPCDFPIKIMGKSQQEFTQIALAIVKYHAPDFDDTSITVKASKNGTYLSITCTIRATSRSQLDALYQALSDHPLVAVVL